METVKFENLGLSKEILKAIGDMGFEEATPIQTQSIPYLMQGRDVIGQAQTGTGKTTAFGIPILESIDPKVKKPQALILCPTRELAIQVSEEIKRLSKYLTNVRNLPIYGGQPIDRQIRGLKHGVEIIIGTPGRIMDHMRRNTLKLDAIKQVVLDEADVMLDMGFREDIETILSGVPKERQTIFFSATMPKPILNLTKRYQNNPEFVKVVHKDLTVPSIEQIYFEVKERTKLEVLTRLIDMYNPNLSLVFCNTKRRVDEVVTQLQARGYFVDGLHGDLNQAKRDRVMDKFRKGTIEILVATDVAARGIDVENVECVFNYDTPRDEEYYVHRIGRTGRAGKTGRAFTFVVGKEIYKLKDIQRYAKTKVTRQDVPTLSDVEDIKINIFLDKIKNVLDEGNFKQHMKYVDRLLEEDYTSVEIAASLVKLAVDNQQREEIEEESGMDDTGGEPGMVRLFINIGKKHKVKPGDILGAIAGETGVSGKLIGTIDIFDGYTFVEVPKDYAKEVLMIMKNNQIKGKKISIEPAKGKK